MLANAGSGGAHRVSAWRVSWTMEMCDTVIPDGPLGGQQTTVEHRIVCYLPGRIFQCRPLLKNGSSPSPPFIENTLFKKKHWPNITFTGASQMTPETR